MWVSTPTFPGFCPSGGHITEKEISSLCILLSLGYWWVQGLADCENLPSMSHFLILQHKKLNSADVGWTTACVRGGGVTPSVPLPLWDRHSYDGETAELGLHKTFPKFAIP